MRKIIITLLILLCMCINVNAYAVNPSFENGLSGWNAGPFGTGTATSSNAWATNGDYSIRFYKEGSSYSYNQLVDLTGVNTITFDTRGRRVSGSEAVAQGQVLIYNTALNNQLRSSVKTYTSTAYTVSLNQTIDVSALNGQYYLIFYAGGATNINGPSTGEVYFDNIRFDGMLEPVPELTGTLYIDDTPSNKISIINQSAYPDTIAFWYKERIDFSISEYEENVLYIVNGTNSNDTYDFVWTFDPSLYAGWEQDLDTKKALNKYALSEVYRPKNLNIMYPALNEEPVEYTFKLYKLDTSNNPLSDAIFNILRFVTSYDGLINWLENWFNDDVNMVELDTIRLVLAVQNETPIIDYPPTDYNITEPDFVDIPEYIPNENISNDFPDIPDFPDFPNGNEGEEITEESENDTIGYLNSSILNSYYSGVDKAVEGVLYPLNSTVVLLLSPVNYISNIVDDINTNFSLYQPNNNWIIQILGTFFNGMPNKVIMFFNFKILLAIILAVFDR